MTTPVYQVTIEGNVLAKLELLNEAISPPSLMHFMMTDVDPFLRERARARFQNEGDEVAGRWAQLREATVNLRSYGIQKGHYLPGVTPSHPINVRTGGLRDYIRYGPSVAEVWGGGVQFTYPMAPSDALVKKKLRVAQKGDLKSRTVARPVLAVGVKDMAYVLTRLERHIRFRVDQYD